MIDENYIKRNYQIIKESRYIGNYLNDRKFDEKFILTYNPKTEEWDIFSVARYNPKEYNIESTEKTLVDGLREYENQFAMAHADSKMRKQKSVKSKPKRKVIKKCKCK